MCQKIPFVFSDCESEFACDFCSLQFSSRNDRNTHTLEHFAKKTCSDCNKNVVRIGDEWYELHFHLVNDEIKCERSPEIDTRLIEQRIEADQYTTNDYTENESLHEPFEEEFFPSATITENIGCIKIEGVSIVRDEGVNEHDEINLTQAMEFYPDENKSECVEDAGITVIS